MRISTKRSRHFLENYRQVKSSFFDFEKIGLFFKNCSHEEEHQVLSDRTLQDLDFEELFMYIDRTCSSIGQQ